MLLWIPSSSRQPRKPLQSYNEIRRASSSTGQSTGLLSRGLQVRALPRLPLKGKGLPFAATHFCFWGAVMGDSAGTLAAQEAISETTAASFAGFHPRRRAWPRCACANNAPSSWPASVRRSRSERSPESLLLPIPKSLWDEDRGDALDAGNLATGGPSVLFPSHRVGWIKVPDRYGTMAMTLFPIEAVTRAG